MNKLKNFKWSLGFLIIGTIISIAIGQMLANSFNSPYQYIIGLLSEIVVIVISLGLFFYEINTRIVDLIRDHDLFVSAGEFIIKSDDASFKNAYNNIKEQLKELVKGHCVLDDLQAVYNDDIESIMALKPGEKLYSMCPVGSIFEEVSMQFTNKSFQSSMEEHYKAVNRGVIVQRLYIFESKTLFNDVRECKLHLAEANINNIDVKLIFLDDHRFSYAEKLPHDIIIFSNKKVSVGRVGPNSRVDGADVWASRNKIDFYYKKYKQLLRLSEQYKESSIKREKR